MPKPLVSGLGSWRHGRARGNNKLTISGSAGFSTIASPFCVRWLRGVLMGLDERTRPHFRWIQEVRSIRQPHCINLR